MILLRNFTSCLLSVNPKFLAFPEFSSSSLPNSPIHCMWIIEIPIRFRLCNFVHSDLSMTSMSKNAMHYIKQQMGWCRKNTAWNCNFSNHVGKDRWKSFCYCNIRHEFQLKIAIYNFNQRLPNIPTWSSNQFKRFNSNNSAMNMHLNKVPLWSLWDFCTFCCQWVLYFHFRSFFDCEVASHFIVTANKRSPSEIFVPHMFLNLSFPLISFFFFMRIYWNHRWFIVFLKYDEALL